MNRKKEEKELTKSSASAVLFLENGIGTRISAICDKVGGKPVLAKMAGVSISQIHRYVSGDSEPKLSAATAIARAGNVTVEWLSSGERSDSTTTSPNNGNGKFTFIPLYDVAAAAGCGVVVDEERVVDSLAFSSSWLKKKLGIAAENLYLINVEGESMEPTLRQGNVILVNHADNTVTRDGIYVLRIGDSLLVKRLQRLPNAIIKVISDNPTYPPYDIDLSDNSGNEVAIIGRAVWSGHEL